MYPVEFGLSWKKGRDTCSFPSRWWDLCCSPPGHNYSYSPTGFGVPAMALPCLLSAFAVAFSLLGKRFLSSHVLCSLSRGVALAMDNHCHPVTRLMMDREQPGQDGILPAVGMKDGEEGQVHGCCWQRGTVALGMEEPCLER